MSPTQDTQHQDDDDPERTICFCHCVSYQTLVDAIRKGSRTLDEIRNETRASTGCTGCECEVLDILEAELAKLKDAEDAGKAGETGLARLK